MIIARLMFVSVRNISVKITGCYNIHLMLLIFCAEKAAVYEDTFENRIRPRSDVNCLPGN
jgi:hypothetical protein